MKRKIIVLTNYLDKKFENPKCELNYSTPFELLVAVILSAQCTDKRVNQVTSTLFKEYNTPEQFANLSSEELERKIQSLHQRSAQSELTRQFIFIHTS